MAHFSAFGGSIISEVARAAIAIVVHRAGRAARSGMVS